ncbi:GNAT family N-acetyltransferase [Alkalihalobacillus deserti]|uniref:GNAT family N-acetyltransferase n=1 Tax=Alkalihalobacillus deserti TaxID=2879466 RepID=UPI001D15D088|nr:GNAT family N-acetyltransferase [Alkalihalobacillus deserti]
MYMQKLEKEHAQSFREIRLLALEKVPEAFAASYEEEVDKPISFFESQLTAINYYGMFDEKKSLVGIVNVTRSNFLKTRHKADLGSVYVRKEARGKGVAKKLLRHAMEMALKEGIEQVNLIVAANNERAKQLYQSLGFESYGYEKRALKLENVYIDEEYMVKLLY